MTHSNGASAPLAIGQELPTRTQRVTQEGISLFHETSGGSNPLHTDEKLARESGYGAPVQHGVRSLYPMFSMLFDRDPHAFLKGAQLEAKFIATVMPGDVLVSHCRLTERTAHAAGESLVFEIWAENQKQQKVVVGTATVPAQ